MTTDCWTLPRLLGAHIAVLVLYQCVVEAVLLTFAVIRRDERAADAGGVVLDFREVAAELSAHAISLFSG